jgi:hypothetical protein
MCLPLLDSNEYNGELLKTVKIKNGVENKYTFDFSNITEKEQTALYKVIEQVLSMRTEWTYLKPFDLENGKSCITDSWKYEYSIFELVRIYK